MKAKRENVNGLKELLRDLVWLNGVIATELIRITENTAAILMGKDSTSPCGPQHAKLNEQIIEILEKHLPEKIEILKGHVLKHE